MACYNPIAAFRTPDGVVFSALGRHDIRGDVELPCGKCLGCRLRRSREWAIRCMHESQMWRDNCFVTLTYDDASMPAYGDLNHRDFQKFMKRMRKAAKHRIRFFMCGEYGELRLRPHYHALLFNKDFRDRKARGKSGSGQLFYESGELSKLWPHGLCTVQDLTPETAAYCTRYVVDKMYGDPAKMAPEYQAKFSERYEYVTEDGEIREREREYCACSLKPGIGAEWFKKYGEAKARQDFVVIDGTEFNLPRYYDKLADRRKFEFLEQVEHERVMRAKEAFADNTPERLRVREKCHAARVRNQRRDF